MFLRKHIYEPPLRVKLTFDIAAVGGYAARLTVPLTCWVCFSPRTCPAVETCPHEMKVSLRAGSFGIYAMPRKWGYSQSLLECSRPAHERALRGHAGNAWPGHGKIFSRRCVSHEGQRETA
jgi:hypothetical protein